MPRLLPQAAPASMSNSTLTVVLAPLPRVPKDVAGWLSTTAVGPLPRDAGSKMQYALPLDAPAVLLQERLSESV